MKNYTILMLEDTIQITEDNYKIKLYTKDSIREN